MSKPDGHRTVLGAMLLFVSVLLAGCDVVVGGIHKLQALEGRASEAWSRSYSLGSEGSVEVVNTNGRIDVVAYEGTAVRVSVEKLVKALTDEAAKELLREVTIAETVSPGRLRLESRHPRRLAGASVELRYTLRVPKTARIDVRNSNGRVEVVGASGPVVAETVNGGVVGRELEGPVRASVVNGGVTVDLAAVTGEGVDLDATNGGITLRLPRTANADITARVTNGGIAVTGLELEEVGEKTRRRLTARLNGGGPRIELATVNGGIRIGDRDRKDAK